MKLEELNEKTQSNRTAYKNQVLKALGKYYNVKNRFTDATSKGYRVKMWRENNEEQQKKDIEELQHKLNQLGFKDVDVAIRGKFDQFVSIIVPIKLKELNEAPDLDRRDVEIRDQAHQMDAEGMHEFKPTKKQITDLLAKENWKATDIDINFDDTQKFWRWYTPIKKIN